MDKYEYQVCADQIKTLIKERHFSEAMDIADTIDWRRVKSFSMLCTVSEIYKVNKHYTEARDILLLAYERYPDRANVVYALCELAIKLDDISEAVEYYKEYVRLRPHDSNKYVLLYKIYEAQEVPIEERISLLEEFKKFEYLEKWAYELALLYHKDGQETKCVETCNELVLWFGDGPYVKKALELKMQHAPLTIDQQKKYDGVTEAPVVPKNDSEEQVHIYETQSMNSYANGASPYETAPIGDVPAGYPGAGQQDPYQDINVQPMSTDKYSTINLQEELARNMEEFYMKDKEEVAAPYYGSTSQLYEPSQAQFMQQINQAGAAASDDMGAYAQQGYGQNQQYAQASVQQMPPIAEEPQYAQQPQQPVQQMPPVAEEPQYAQQLQQPVQQMHQPAEPKPITVPSYLQSAHETAEEETNIPELVVPVYEENGNNTGATIDPPPSYNGQSGVPKQYEDKLKEGLDGQVTMNLPEPKVAEKQITGQIDISDFMREFEAKKRSGEEQRRAQIKAKGIEQTNDIMAQLIGVIPGFDRGIEGVSEALPPMQPAPQAGYQPESQPMVPQSGYPEYVQPVMQPMHPPVTEDAQYAQQSQKGFSAGNNSGMLQESPMAPVSYGMDTDIKRSESGSVINGPKTSSLTGEIPDILPNADIMEKGDILPSGHRLTIDEQYGGNIARIREEDAELVKRMTGELPPAEEVKPQSEEIPEVVDYGEAEEIVEIEQPDVELEGDDVKEEDPRPVTGSIPPLDIPQSEDNNKLEPPSEQLIDSYENNIASGDSLNREDNADVSEEEPVSYPYEIDEDLGEVEELVDLDQPEEVDDILKTRPIPVEEIEAMQRLEAGTDDMTSEADSRKSPTGRMVMEEKITSRRDFEDIERAIFGRFEGIESLKAQIVDVMDYMSMDPRHGNVVVIGSELFGRKDIALDIVRATQAFDKKFLGKVAKISGEALNKKNIPNTLSKLRNGALIVENAGGLSPMTINSITEALLTSDEPIMVVLEGEKDTIEPLLNGCAETRTVFDARIVIKKFNDDDLVAYAKGYAREQEYSIDEMGTLALHTKIADMQTYDHSVSIQEVMDIIDNAIRHVDRKNMSHFMDVLVGKRYDDEDFIVLREKDFIS